MKDMKIINTMWMGIFLVLAAVSPGVHIADAASMNDYCATPPFIGTSVTPNMLMMLDNSASMEDLNYVDKGTATRPPMYCYDNTYVSAPTVTYAGYFDTGSYYDFDFAAAHLYFSKTASFPAAGACVGPSTLASISNTLFVCYDTTTRTVSRFLAIGNYLNWLTMSKFDIQKQILTGGKYDPSDLTLTAESRGCVGYKYIKQPLTVDYVEGGTNTPLNITFGISGPVDPYNPSAPSPPGQTSIDIYLGKYNSAVCQTAINDFANPSIQKQTLIDDIGTCIGYSATNKNTCQYGGAPCSSDAQCGYSFTAGTCGAIVPNGTCGALSGGACSTSTAGVCNISNGTCPAAGGTNGVCVGGSKAGTACANNTPCKGGGTCTRYCSGGGKAGSVCGTDTNSSSALCAFSQCTAGNTSKTSCSANSDCDLKHCTNTGPKNGQTCSLNADCNSGKCSAGKPATTDCLVNGDCNSATAYCTAGKPNTTACVINTDCDLKVVGNGQCLPPASVQLKSTYGQTQHTCYQLLFKGQSLQPGDLNAVSGNNGCNLFYPAYMTCNGGAKDGLVCTGAADCPSGTCIKGPAAIRPGSPVLICGLEYAGACAATTDNWATSGNVSWPGGDACVTAAITQYCNDTQVSNVVDPTEQPAATSYAANLPAILGDTGLSGQLGDPIGRLPVTVLANTEPTGLLQDYANRIRMGFMIFNPYGSPTECSTTYPPAAGEISCPKYCSTNPILLCGSPVDCPSPATAKCLSKADYLSQGFSQLCYNAASNLKVTPDTTCTSDANCGIGQVCVPGNGDGSKIIHYIGYGHCALVPSTACSTDANCTSVGDYCVSTGVGNHSSGLISEIDSVAGAVWTPFSEAFYNAIGYFAKTSTGKSRTDLRINTADFNENFNPSQRPCQDNNILLITDGMSTADRNTNVNSLAGVYTAAGGASGWTGTCPIYKGSVNLDNLSWIANHRRISDFSLSTQSTTPPSNNNEKINTYVVYAGAMSSTITTNECDAQTLLSQTATNGGTTLQVAENPDKLKASLTSTFESISKKAASGSAVSVLTTSSRGVGSMLQAYFLPEKIIGKNTVNWLGYTQNIWIDTKDDLREDTTNDFKLILDSANAATGDRVMRLFLDTHTNLAGETRAAMFTTDADGNGGSLASCSSTTSISFDQVSPIWEGGKMLANMSDTDRTIFTAIPTSVAGGDSGQGMNHNKGISFVQGNLITYATLGTALNPDADYSAADILNYTRGKALEDPAVNSSGNAAKFRSRLLQLASAPTTTVVWKLGDIINATPKVVGNLPQNTYFIDYGDSTYFEFISSDPVRQRTSAALIGANDGMLHSFRVGYLKDRADNNGALDPAAKALFRNSYSAADAATSDLGKEMWAYVPYSVLPYLKYYASPDYGNCHLYYVDLSVKVYDASIGGPLNPGAGDTKNATSWHTILLGGMRFGGACNSSVASIPAGPPISTAGFSSYFALDITDIENPVPLWEFTDADLGYTVSAPAIIRTGGTAINGNWYVVFGSGPTQLPRQSRDIARHAKRGYLYVVNLKTGALVKKMQLANNDSANDMVGDVLVIDADKNYTSEKAYWGTTYCTTYSVGADNEQICTSGWKGRIMSLEIPDQDLAGSPAWTPEIHTLFDGNFPFTASVDVAKDALGNKWVYAGSGKYYSGLDQTDSTPQIFMGFIDKGSPGVTPAPVTVASAGACPNTCASTTQLCEVTNCITSGAVPTQGGTVQACLFDPDLNSFATTTIVTNITNASTVPQSPIGWSIYLGAREKAISRPLAVGGVVDFLTYIPSADICSHGGESYLSAVDYTLGVAPSSVAIRAVKSTTSDAAGTVAATSGTVFVQRKVHLGPGAPPSGEAIIITPPKEGQDKLKKKIQVSTGVIVETENKPMISTVSKIINWLKK
jgi:type IV pilus assembly protein PilY1